MAEHGTRARYRAGCRCLPCRAANAAYDAWLYQQHKIGKRPLGAAVPARRAWEQARRLLIEGFTPGELARLLGTVRVLRFSRQGRGRITLRTALKVQRIYRAFMAEGHQLHEGEDG